ncbi:MAG: hypothetical protein ACM3U2_06995 [Deltaproteobacteria bacterium]
MTATLNRSRVEQLKSQNENFQLVLNRIEESFGPRSNHVTILERTDQSTDSRIDPELGIWRNVAVINRQSKNDREYSDRALDQICEMADGISVHVDHPNPENARVDRPLSTKFGVLKNLRREKDRVMADLFYLRNHPLAPQLTEAAARLPRSFGLSINGDGDTVITNQGRRVVDNITKLRSVDLVSRPGATDGIWESAEDEVTDMEDEGNDPNDVVDDDDDFETKIRKLWARDDLQESEKVAMTKDLIGITGQPASGARQPEVVGNTGSPGRSPAGPDQLGVGDRRSPRSSGGAGSGPAAGTSVPAPRFSESLMEQALHAPPSFAGISRTNRRLTRKAPARQLMESTSAQLPMPKTTADFVRIVTGRSPR